MTDGDKNLQSVDEEYEFELKETKKNRQELRYPPKQTVHARFMKLIQKLQCPKTGLAAVSTDSERGGLFEYCEKCQRKPSNHFFELPILFHWLQDNWEFGDINETSHFVKCACSMGYIYPCSFDWNVNTLKCSGSDSMKFGIQIPGLWPITNIPPHDVDYAKHLLSRSLAHREPPLDDYDQMVLSKLERNYYSQWSFLTKMCEHEKTYTSNLCDHDKRIQEWQEFAYWKTKHPRFLSSDSKPLNRSRIEKSKIDVVTREEESSEIVRLNYELAVRRIRRICVDWELFDPFLSSTPSYNPWQAEDDVWPMKEDESLPTVYQVKQWGQSFEKLLADELGIEFFDEQLQKEFSVENLDFYLDCMELKRAPISQVEALNQAIYDKYIHKDAPHPINIDTKTMNITKKELKGQKTRYSYEAALDHIYNLMKKDSYRRFVLSNVYRGAVASATDPVVPETKKKTQSFKTKSMMLKFWT